MKSTGMLKKARPIYLACSLSHQCHPSIGDSSKSIRRLLLVCVRKLRLKRTMTSWSYSGVYFDWKSLDIAGMLWGLRSIIHAYAVYSLEALRNAGQGGVMFSNRIRTDGYSVDFEFARRRKPDSQIIGTDLDLQSFDAEEIERNFIPCAIDPGICQAFTAAYGDGEVPHEVRQASTSEYYMYTGSPQRLRELQKEKRTAGIDVLESQLDTGKTVFLDDYVSYTNTLLRNLERFFTFYGPHRAEDRFHNYQGTQRAREELVNIIVTGSKKYNRRRRSKTRKNRKSRAVNRIRKRRKKRERKSKEPKQELASRYTHFKHKYKTSVPNLTAIYYRVPKPNVSAVRSTIRRWRPKRFEERQDAVHCFWSWHVREAKHEIQGSQTWNSEHIIQYA